MAVAGISRTQAYDPEMKEIEVAARALGVQLQPVDLRGPNDLEKAFSAMTRKRAGTLIGLQTRNIFNLRKRIGELAVNSRLPAVSFIDSLRRMAGLSLMDRNLPTYIDARQLTWTKS